MRDLKNKRFAFGSVDSTQGHLIPRIILHEHDILLTDLASYEYTGSHQSCAGAVVSFKFDACGMQDTMAKKMEKQGLLKILHASDYYHSSGIGVNQNLPLEIISKVEKALMGFDPHGKDKGNLFHWSQTEMPNGFTTAKKEDYLELSKWLVSLGIMKPSSERDTTH